MLGLVNRASSDVPVQRGTPVPVDWRSAVLLGEFVHPQRRLPVAHELHVKIETGDALQRALHGTGNPSLGVAECTSTEAGEQDIVGGTALRIQYRSPQRRLVGCFQDQ